MTGSELVGRITDDLALRSTWDTRQAMFYEMRFNGLRRRSKPWPGASDVHFPLANSVLEKLKPFYFQQLFATDQLAAFVPNRAGVDANLAAEAAAWFDYQLKQNSNLEAEILIVIDKMLMSGRPALKVIWDAREKRLKFVTVPAHQLIVPPETRALADADRIVHVQTYSVEAYRREGNFQQDEALIRRITGSGTARDSENTPLDAAKYRREGLTHGGTDQIVLWEIWTRDAQGAWQFQVLSPLAPDAPVRTRTGCVYAHGGPPFVDFPYEVNDAGYYSARGVVEIVAVFEAELCKLLNEKNDAMTLFNRPLFTTDSQMPNTGNLRWVPGQILPFNVRPVEMPAPPVSFDIQINLMREIAEGLVATPDFGMSQRGSPADPRTATEINAIGVMTQQSSDLRMRIFRQSLGRLYRMAWSLLRQYARDSLAIYADGKLTEVKPGSLADAYAIQPSGSADGVNRMQAAQKSMQRFQVFRGDPFINQGELRKALLESDDAGLVKRLYQDPGLEAANQAEKQAGEIAILRLGFPAVVSPADDDTVHLQTVMAYVTHQSQIGQAPKGSELQFIGQHAQQHLAQLQQKDPKAAKQALNAMGVLAQMLHAQAQTQGMGQGQPQPPPGGGGMLDGPESPGSEVPGPESTAGSGPTSNVQR